MKSFWNFEEAVNYHLPKKGYLFSWHFAQTIGATTRKVNYELTKLVKQGRLIKYATCYGTYYAKKIEDLPEREQRAIARIKGDEK